MTLFLVFTAGLFIGFTIGVIGMSCLIAGSDNR